MTIVSHSLGLGRSFGKQRALCRETELSNMRCPQFGHGCKAFHSRCSTRRWALFVSSAVILSPISAVCGRVSLAAFSWSISLIPKFPRRVVMSVSAMSAPSSWPKSGGLSKTRAQSSYCPGG